MTDNNSDFINQYTTANSCIDVLLEQLQNSNIKAQGDINIGGITNNNFQHIIIDGAKTDSNSLSVLPTGIVSNVYVNIISIMNIKSVNNFDIPQNLLTGKYNVIHLSNVSNIPNNGKHIFSNINSITTTGTSQYDQSIDNIFNNLYTQAKMDGLHKNSTVYRFESLSAAGSLGLGNSNSEKKDLIAYVKNSKVKDIKVGYLGNSLLLVLENTPGQVNVVSYPEPCSPTICPPPTTCPLPTTCPPCKIAPPITCPLCPESSNSMYYFIICCMYLIILSMLAYVIFSKLKK